jgi:prevent-host-death family protein
MAMTRRFSIADAKVNLERILDLTDAGQVVELTRAGRPVAAVISLAELARLRGERQSFSDAYERFNASHPVAEDGLEESWLDDVRAPASGADRKTKADLIAAWTRGPRLSPEDAEAFAQAIEAARAELRPPRDTSVKP